MAVQLILVGIRVFLWGLPRISCDQIMCIKTFTNIELQISKYRLAVRKPILCKKAVWPKCHFDNVITCCQVNVERLVKIQDIIVK